MTFGVSSSQVNLSIPAQDFSNTNADYLVAPLWFPNISTEILNTSVSWEAQSEGDKNTYLLEFAERAVDDYSQFYYGVDAEFSPNWAMVVTWNISLIPDFEVQEKRCCKYMECDCQDDSYHYEFFYYCNEQDYESNNTTCNTNTTRECYAENGWSTQDVNYLSLLCNAYSYYLPEVSGFSKCFHPTSQHSLFLKLSVSLRYSFSWCLLLMDPIPTLSSSTNVTGISIFLMKF